MRMLMPLQVEEPIITEWNFVVYMLMYAQTSFKIL